MKIIKDKYELQAYSSYKQLGFVPTMGALHEGHFSLIKRCVSENESSLVSIYVNPSQFLPGEDFLAYPRDIEADLKACKNLGVDAVFLPDDLYFQTEPLIKAPLKIASILEGSSRPGHFDGVLTVVNKLFNLCNPKRAYFGKKDAQQLYLVENMTQAFFMDTKIIACEIVRAKDGLALSSRNVYLSKSEREEALKLSKSLKLGEKLAKQGAKLDEISLAMRELLASLSLDYLAFMDEDFSLAKGLNKRLIILVAAHFSKCRLLDNVWIENSFYN